MVVRYKFIYFPARGRGELIRYMFAKIQVPYEEQLVEFKDWPDEKMSNKNLHFFVTDLNFHPVAFQRCHLVLCQFWKWTESCWLSRLP